MNNSQKTNFFLLASMLLVLTFCVSAQKKRDEFKADLNGNGKLDRIVTVKYKKSVRLPSYSNRTECETRNGYFAKFVLYLDNQKPGVTIFDYFIGDDQAIYWQYKINEAIDLNKDGVKDLVFYAGDDTTEEYVFLIQKPSHYKAVFSGTLELEYFSKLNNLNDITIKTDDVVDGKEINKVLAKWNAEREVFEGDKIYWVTEDCVGLYEKPDKTGKILSRLYEGDIIKQPDVISDKNGWQKIKVDTFDGSQEGWIETRYLSTDSLTKEFTIK